MGHIVAAGCDRADCPEVWASRVAAAADLPDQRLNARLADILHRWSQRPNDSIPQASGDAYAAKSTYRFLANRRFTHQPLVEAVAEATLHSCQAYERLYVPQDSSSLNYSSLHGTTGLGRLGAGADAAGLLIHSALACCPKGIVRGLLSLDLWHRPVDVKTKEQRYERPFEEKESFKWVRSMQAVRAAVDRAWPAGQRPRLVHLMDREGDIHEVFADIVAHGEGAIIRCAQNRKIDGDIAYAHAAVAATASLGSIKLHVRTKSGAKRPATLQLRALPVLLTPNQRDYPGRLPLSLNLIEAREVDPPAGAEAVRWLLWTTEAIGSRREVLERLREYTWRWRIEEYHLTLKSGCNTEGLLLEKAERLCKAITLYAAVAARIVMLRDLGRHAPDTPATVLLSAEEIDVLQARFAKKSERDTTPTIRQAMLWIGRLGGHLGRQRDTLPGVRTLWRGWRDLAIMVFGYRLNRHRKS